MMMLLVFVSPAADAGAVVSPCALGVVVASGEFRETSDREHHRMVLLLTKQTFDDTDELHSGAPRRWMRTENGSV